MDIVKTKKYIVAFLYSLGLSLTILASFGMYRGFLTATITIAFIAGLFLLFSFGKLYKFIGLAVTGAFLVFSIISGSLQGFLLESYQMIKAIIMLGMGSSQIFLAYHSQFAIIISLIIVLFTMALSDEDMSFIPLVLPMVFIMYLLLQICPKIEYIYTLPAWLALLIKAVNPHRLRDIKSHIAIFLILALSFLIMPLFLNSFPPLSNMAQSIKQQIRDYLFFTEEREVFSLESYGYYPYGAEVFGGKVALSDKPVMTVKTDKKLLLRAVTKDFYTGYNFVSTTGKNRYLYINPRWRGLREKVLCENLPSKNISENSSLLKKHEIQIEVYKHMPTTLLMPAYPRSLSTTGDMVAYFNDPGEVFITRNVKLGDKYSVQAPIIQGGDPGLAALVSSSEDKGKGYYEEIYSTYTQLPRHLEPALYDLKNRIVRDSDSPYQRALAIMNYLKHSYGYSLNVNDVPENVDFVSYFLLVSKEGYCVYFASAMTVLARMADIPARYVEGFMVNPDSDGLARVTEKNAHAWCEIYLRGFGWLPIDATAQRIDQDSNTTSDNEDKQDPESSPSPSPTPSGAPQPEPSPAPAEQSPSPSPTIPNMPNEDTEPENSKKSHDGFWQFLLMLVALIALASYGYFVQPEQRANREETINNKISIYSLATMIMLNNYKNRLPRYKKFQTLYEYALIVDNKDILPLSLIPFASAMSKTLYSSNQSLLDEFNIVEESFNKIYNSLKWYRKVAIRLIWAYRTFGNFDIS